MGSGASAISEIKKEWLNIFKAMKLRNKEISKLYDIYNTVDADRSGSIDVVELLMFLDIERTLFTERIFQAFDKDHTHRIDFYEFVVSVWKFCTLGKEATSVFAFDLYDTNADGRLSSKDVHTMFRELLGSKALEEEPVIQRAVADLLKEEINDHIGVESFRIFIRMHQALLFPVFGIQNKLRITTLGIPAFEKLSKRRIEIRQGCTVPLSDLMVLHSHRKMFFEILSDQTILRVSSMMRIVLDNTDNALHGNTPPASPRHNPTEVTKILNPFPTAASMGFGPAPGHKDDGEHKKHKHHHHHHEHHQHHVQAPPKRVFHLVHPNIPAPHPDNLRNFEAAHPQDHHKLPHKATPVLADPLLCQSTDVIKAHHTAADLARRPMSV